MALTKIRLGDYIERSTINNRDLKYGVELIEGVTNEGIFSVPKGDPTDVDLKPYKIVKDGAFVYNPSRLDLGSIAYRTEGLCIVSHLYIVFYLNEHGKKIIDPMWLYMYFRRKEFYREVSFRNFGSQRPEFNFNDMSDIIIPLPDISVQRKYAGIYNAMLANQRSYERGLEDLKQAVFAEIDIIKHSVHRVPVGELFQEIDVSNTDGSITNVQGINIEKQFMPSVADTASVNLKNYKVVRRGQFAYSSMQTGRDECIRIALYDKDEPTLISPAYSVLEVKDPAVVAEYIMLWFSRPETDRYGWFASDASVRANLDLDRFYEIQIPLPDTEKQQAIANIYIAYMLRREINEQLKAQIRNICPILIKGSVEEASA